MSPCTETATKNPALIDGLGLVFHLQVWVQRCKLPLPCHWSWGRAGTILSSSCLVQVKWRARPGLTHALLLIVQSAVLNRSLSPCCLQQALWRLKISRDFLYRTGDDISHCPWIGQLLNFKPVFQKYASMCLAYSCSSSDLLKILALQLYIAEHSLHSQFRQTVGKVCSWVIYRALSSTVPLPFLYKARACWAENMTLSSGYADWSFGT